MGAVQELLLLGTTPGTQVRASVVIDWLNIGRGLLACAVVSILTVLRGELPQFKAVVDGVVGRGLDPVLHLVQIEEGMCGALLVAVVGLEINQHEGEVVVRHLFPGFGRQTLFNHSVANLRQTVTVLPQPEYTSDDVLVRVGSIQAVAGENEQVVLGRQDVLAGLWLAHQVGLQRAIAHGSRDGQLGADSSPHYETILVDNALALVLAVGRVLVAESLVGCVLAHESADGITEACHCEQSFPDEGHEAGGAVLELCVLRVVQETGVEFAKRCSYTIQSQTSPRHKLVTYPLQCAGAEKLHFARHS